MLTYDDYIDALRVRESSDDYGAVNQYNYLGGYQFGEKSLYDTGYVKKDNAWDNTYTWTGKGGIHSDSDFLNNHSAQDTAMREYNQKIWHYIDRHGLKDYIGTTIDGHEITASGMLAGGHLVGMGALKQYLDSGGTVVPHDGNDVPITDYIDEFAGYETPFDPNEPDTIGSAETCGMTLWAEAAVATVRHGDPLVLDLDGDGIELSSRVDSNVYFDYGHTSSASQTGWATGGDGMLVDDINDNDAIDDVSELIGGNSGSGFGDLATVYDSNTDGVINSSDTNFGRLRVWVDSDEDGFTDSGELHTLGDLNITSISLAAQNATYEINGNNVTQESTFVMDSETHTMVDVWYAYDTVNTTYSGEYTLDMETLFLPEQRGYGTLPDLSIAMSLDGDLKGMVSDLAAKSAADLFDEYDVQAAVRDILIKWAGVDGVELDTLGSGLDTQQLAFLEAVMGQEYNTNPYGYAALATMWDVVTGAMTANILAQAGLSDALGNPLYDPVTDTLDGHAAVLHFGAGAGWGAAMFNDIYVFRPGDGSAGAIFEQEGGGNDTIFIGGVDPAAVTVTSTFVTGLAYQVDITYSEGDVIRLLTSYDSVSGAIYNPNVEHIAFDDGTVWDLTAGLTLTVDANTLYNDLVGTNGDDTLISTGSSGGYLSAAGGNDTLVAAGTNYALSGDAGDDTYVFTAGAGNASTVIEYADKGDDTVALHGVDPGDVEIWSEYYLYSGYYYLHVKYDAENMLNILVEKDPVTGAMLNTGVEQIVFDDTTVWDLTGGLTLESAAAGNTLAGTDHNDTLTLTASYGWIDGYGGADTLTSETSSAGLYGGAGDDTLVAAAGGLTMSGGTGDDTYAFTAGTGNGSVVWEYEDEGTDTIFLHDVLTGDVEMWTDSGQLHLKYDESNTIHLSMETAGNGAYISHVEQVAFDDTTVWDISGGLTLEKDSATLYGTNDDDHLSGSGSTVMGYDGDDVLAGLYMTGGDGADTFKIKDVGTHFAFDFNAGDGDKIDISDVLTGYDPLYDTLTDFVQITDNTVDSTVYVDQDGTGTTYSMTQVASIWGATGLTDEAALVLNGTLIVQHA
jgi:hypothetical protein